MPSLVLPIRLPSRRRHTHAHTQATVAASVASALHHEDSDDHLPGLQPKRRGLPFRRPSQVAASTITDVEIHYGSMTGTAERFAHALASDITARGVCVTVHDLEQFDEASFANRDRFTHTRVFVFVVSTHFAGAPSPSAERFHDWLLELCEQGRFARDPVNDVENLVRTESKAAGTVSPWSDFVSWIASAAHMGHLNHVHLRGQQFAGMQYAVFGVGDSMYLTYNAMGKFVDAKLSELRANRFCSMGLGDSSKDIEMMYQAWRKQFLCRLPFHPQIVRIVTVKEPSVGSRILAIAPETAPITSVSEPNLATMQLVMSKPGEPILPAMEPVMSMPGAALEPSPPKSSYRDNFGRPVRLRYRCRFLDREDFGVSDTDAVQNPEVVPSRPSASPKHSHCAELLSIKRVNEGHPLNHQVSQAVILRLKLIDPDLSFDTAGNIAIFPQNSVEHVEHIAAIFGFDLDASFALYFESSRDAYVHHQALPFPTPCTVRCALTEYVELRSVTREFLRVASGFVSTDSERDKLEQFASIDGSPSFKALIQDQYKGIADMIEVAPTLKIPFEVFVNIAAMIKPRFYSIASSPRLCAQELDLAISLGRPEAFKGLATAYFSALLTAASPRTNSKLRGFLTSTRFHLPEDASAPMIMIANGVGVAPMRGLLQDRRVLSNSSREANQFVHGANVLFLGCTGKDSFAFQEDIHGWEAEGFLVLHLALSKDPHHPKAHVDQVVSTHLDSIHDMMINSSSATILVCGTSSMARQIRDIFQADQRARNSNWFENITSNGQFIEESYG